MDTLTIRITDWVGGRAVTIILTDRGSSRLDTIGVREAVRNDTLPTGGIAYNRSGKLSTVIIRSTRSSTHWRIVGKIANG